MSAVELRRWIGLCPKGSLVYDDAQCRWVASSDTATALVGHPGHASSPGHAVVSSSKSLCTNSHSKPTLATVSAIRRRVSALAAELRGVDSPKDSPNEPSPGHDAGSSVQAHAAGFYEKIVFLRASLHRPSDALIMTRGSQIKLALAENGRIPLESSFQVGESSVGAGTGWHVFA